MTLQTNEKNWVSDSEFEVDKTRELAKKLMQTKHYAKMGEEGVFAVVQKAKSLGMSPLDALNGGLYYVQGKVEMSSQAMNQLIRQAGHSIKKDAKSNNEICILHGKRKDNGDIWAESFSIDEAKAAGLYKSGGAWSKYPRDMLFARALSRLARQLFPDILHGCYVLGEISEAPPLHEPVDVVEEAPPLHEPVDVVETVKNISSEQVSILNNLLEGHDEIREKVMEFITRKGGESLADMKKEYFEKVESRVLKLIQEKEDIAKSYELMDMNQEEIENEMELLKEAVEGMEDDQAEY